MKNRHVVTKVFLLALTLALVGMPDAFAGTLTINSDTRMDQIEINTGDTVVMADGQDYTLELAGAGTVFLNNGTFTANDSTVKFSGGDAQSISGGLTFDKLTHDGAGTLSIGAALTCTGFFTNTQGNVAPSASDISTTGLVWTAGNITGTPSGNWDIATGGVDIDGGTFVATGGTFTVAGDWNMAVAAAFTPGTGTVIFDGSAVITSAGKSFNAVTAAADVSLADAFVAQGDFIINSGQTFALAGFACNAAAISNNGIFQMHGDETLTTTTVISGGLVKLVDPEGCTLSTSINGLPNVEFNSNGQGFTLSEGMPYITGDITVAAGTTLTMGQYGMTLADGRTVTNNGTWTTPTAGSVFTCAGTATFAGTDMNFFDFSCIAAGKTLTFADAATFRIGGVLTLHGAAGSNLNIVKSGSGGNPALQKNGTSNVEYVQVDGVDGASASQVITAANSWGQNYQYWQFGTGAVAGGGPWASPLTWGSGHVPGAADDVTIAENILLNTDITVNSLYISANGLSFDGVHTLAVAGSVTVDSDLDVGLGTFSAGGDSLITGTLSIGAGTYTAYGAFDASGGAVTFTGDGTLNLAGDIACGGLGTFTKAAGCTVDYQRAGDQSVGIADGSVNYHHLKLSASGTKTLCGPIDVDGNLTVSDAAVTFDVAASANSITIVGNWLNSGTFAHADATVTFDGTAAVQQITCGTVSPFYNLTINNTAETADDILLADNLDVDGNLLLTDGDLNLGANKEHHFAGNFQIESDGRITTGSNTTFIVFDGTTTLTDNSSDGPQNFGQVEVQ